jgi:hypothetical protein
MKCKVRPFTMDDIFTFYSCLYIFSFRLFSNISKTVFRPSHIRFCREFQVLSFDNEKGFNHRDNRGEILKIQRGQLFIGHPLYIYIFGFGGSSSIESCKKIKKKPLEFRLWPTWLISVKKRSGCVNFDWFSGWPIS